VHVIPADPSVPQASAAPQHGAVQERIGGTVSAPKPTYQPDPPYTTDAKNASIEGISVLSLIVGENGQAKEIWVSRPLGYGLDEMAIGALDTWKFAPALKNGQPVAVKLTVEVEFRMH
jgi:protein TonB